MITGNTAMQELFLGFASRKIYKKGVPGFQAFTVDHLITLKTMLNTDEISDTPDKAIWHLLDSFTGLPNGGCPALLGKYFI